MDERDVAKGGREAPLDLQLRFAWDWFAYHAGQRLTAFNFFLIVMGAVIVGFGNALTHHSRALGAAVGFLGGVVALGFVAMDVRNAELVSYGQDALEEVEASFPRKIRAPDLERSGLGPTIRKLEPVIRHTFWLRLIMTTFCVLSAAGCGWAIAGYPGSAGNRPVAQHAAR